MLARSSSVIFSMARRLCSDGTSGRKQLLRLLLGLWSAVRVPVRVPDLPEDLACYDLEHGGVRAGLRGTFGLVRQAKEVGGPVLPEYATHRLEQGGLVGGIATDEVP